MASTARMVANRLTTQESTARPDRLGADATKIRNLRNRADLLNEINGRASVESQIFCGEPISCSPEPI